MAGAGCGPWTRAFGVAAWQDRRPGKAGLAERALATDCAANRLCIAVRSGVRYLTVGPVRLRDVEVEKNLCVAVGTKALVP
jgi:hypothetical protein